MINSWLIELRQWLVIDTEILPTTSPPAVMNHSPNRYICSQQPLRAPGIMQQMGRDYSNAVTACINGDFESLNHDDGNQSSKGTFISFESQVLSRLSKYIV